MNIPKMSEINSKQRRKNEGTMGIPQFQRLASHDMQVCILKDCQVVIDAQNYFNESYYKSNVNSIFGCDSNEFAKMLRIKTFIFKKANVKCYFVFKGGDSNIQKKINKFGVENANCDLAHIGNNFVLPVLAKDTIKQVLDELKIDYSTCVLESKDECVALADQLGCAVISNDVEFCFKTVPYISHTTMRFNKNENGIECQQFKLKDFLKRNSITFEKAAIFAVLSDSNFYPKEFFQPLLKRWGVFNTNAYQQHSKLVDWLAIHDEKVILIEISQDLSIEDNAIFLENYQKKLASMRNVDGGIVTKYLRNGRQLSIDRHDPEWFEKGVASNIIPIPYINLFKWKVLQGSSAIESKTPKDSLMLSIDIIIYAYNLLTDFKDDNIAVYHDAHNHTDVNTKDTKIRKPNYNSRDCVFGNGWEHVHNYKLFEHFLNENCINPKILKNDDLESMLLIALVYFARKKKQEQVDVTEEVYCIIISYVMLNIVFEKEGSFKRRINNIYEPECIKAKEATEHYFQSNERETMQIFNANKLKTLVEFQYCLLHLNYLNILCGSSYKPTRYHRTYNGTFVYKMLLDMKGSDTDVFITKLFKRSSSVLRYIKKIIKLYHDLM